MKKPLTGTGTICVQGGYKPKNGEPRQIPIIQSTTFRYDTSDAMGKLFDLEAEGYFYSRLQNPTSDAVAAKICELERGVGAILTSSGMAANFMAVFNICNSGDHMISSSAIYGGTYNLFAVTMKKMGIDVTFVSPDATADELDKAFRPNTKLMFGEAIANPSLKVLDIGKFAKIAHSHGVPLIVDNTFPTPVNCRPFEFGADIAVHATTKYMDGHGSTIGGAVVDSGNFDWSKYPEKFLGLCTPDESYHGIIYTENFGKKAYIMKCTSQLMRDFGICAAPINAYILSLGLESLHVRVKRHCESALRVAKYLENNKKITWVKYPGLESNTDSIALVKKYMPGGTCGVISFGVAGGRAAAGKFMESLSIVAIETHVADARSCCLCPATTTHRQLSDAELEEAGVSPDLIRLSVGLEDADDIIADIENALAQI